MWGVWVVLGLVGDRDWLVDKVRIRNGVLKAIFRDYFGRKLAVKALNNIPRKISQEDCQAHRPVKSAQRAPRGLATSVPLLPWESAGFSRQGMA
jgi:hypothetical protein